MTRAGTDDTPGGDAALRVDAAGAAGAVTRADAVAAENAPVDAATGNADQATPGDASVVPLQAVRVAVPQTIKLVKLEYRSAHDVVVFRDPVDLSGPDPGEPTLTTTDLAPLTPPKDGAFTIVHTQATPVLLRAWFVVDVGSAARGGTDMFHLSVTATRDKVLRWGAPVAPEDQGLVAFASGEVDVSGRTFAVDLGPVDGGSGLALARGLRSLSGIKLVWKAQLTLFSEGLPPLRLDYNAGASVVDIFVTLGPPITKGRYPRAEDGVTTARLRKAYLFLAGMDTSDEHALAGAILRKLAKIVLKPNPSLIQFGHPNYFESNATVKGGAWHLIDHLRDGERGECQAMVRLMRALLYLVGAVRSPESASVTVAYAVPTDAKTGDVSVLDSELDGQFGATTDVISHGGLHAFPRTVKVGSASEMQSSALLSVVADKGAKLAATNGLNFYEAALRLEGGGRTLFYAGGISKPFTTIDAILRIHVALIWIADTDPDPKTGEERKIVREVIQGYRDFNRVKP